MKQILHTLTLCTCLLTLSLGGCSTDDLLPTTPDAGDGNNTPGEAISIVASLNTPSTRTGHEDLISEGIKVRWAEGDKFAIYTLNATGERTSGTTFTLVKGDAGKASATFEGKAPVQGASYLICYPVEVQVSTSFAALSLSGQKQTGNNSTAHLSKFDPMLGHTVNEGDFSEISFTPDATHAESGHYAALMTFNLMDIPTDLGTPERIVLSTTAGSKAFYNFAYLSGDPWSKNQHTLTLDLENVTAGQGRIMAYMMMASVSMAVGEQLTITLEGSQKSYTFTAPAFNEEKTYERGMRYIADVGTWTKAVINYDGTANSSLGSFSGKGTETDPYIIRSANNLKCLEGEVNGGTTYTGKYFKLTRDINIAMGSSKTWTPIGTTSKPFKDHFDGGGHTISGEMTGAAVYFGFFGHIEGATITNLHVSATVTGTSADENSVTGAIASYANASAISNCTNAGTISGALYVGGIVGTAGLGDACTLLNCTNTGTVTASSTTEGYAGGIGSYINGESAIIGCANTGKITATIAGGIVGPIINSSKIYGCFNTGLIEAINGTDIGAIVGAYYGSSTISHCQYVYAATQSAGLVAANGEADNSFTSVAKLTDLTALNAAGVTALNAGIATWLAANPGKTCYPFKASSTPSTAPPVIAFPGASSGIGGIGDNGAAWN